MAQKADNAQANSGSKQEYPEDRFDKISHSGRVGAHRVTGRPRYFWQYIIASLLGIALLTTVGIIAVQSIGGTGKLSSSATTTSEATPRGANAGKLDPAATIAVLNGSTTPNLAAALDAIIIENQWGQMLFSGSAATDDVEISAVFYMDPADEEAAKGLAAELGGISTYVTKDYVSYGARLVVLLGSDYVGPGIEEAKLLPGGTDEAPAESAEPEVDPETGFEIDPTTGQLIDPVTGFLIDPESGLPIDPATNLPVQ